MYYKINTELVLQVFMLIIAIHLCYCVDKVLAGSFTIVIGTVSEQYC